MPSLCITVCLRHFHHEVLELHHCKAAHVWGTTENRSTSSLRVVNGCLFSFKICYFSSRRSPSPFTFPHFTRWDYIILQQSMDMFPTFNNPQTAFYSNLQPLEHMHCLIASHSRAKRVPVTSDAFVMRRGYTPTQTFLEPCDASHTSSTFCVTIGRFNKGISYLHINRTLS